MFFNSLDPHKQCYLNKEVHGLLGPNFLDIYNCFTDVHKKNTILQITCFTSALIANVISKIKHFDNLKLKQFKVTQLLFRNN